MIVRDDLEVLNADDRKVEQIPPFCKRHSGERLRRAWRREVAPGQWTGWRFFFCPMCDRP
jgi:hypothetical protein